MNTLEETAAETTIADYTRILNQNRHGGFDDWTLAQSQTPRSDGSCVCSMVIHPEAAPQIQRWPDDVVAIAQAYESGSLPLGTKIEGVEMRPAPGAVPLPPINAPHATDTAVVLRQRTIAIAIP